MDSAEIRSRFLRYFADRGHQVVPSASLLLDDPTKGIDLGAKADLFALMRQQADAGATIIFYSSEDSEIIDYAEIGRAHV